VQEWVVVGGRAGAKTPLDAAGFFSFMLIMTPRGSERFPARRADILRGMGGGQP
jgi:hypothetical protein